MHPVDVLAPLGKIMKPLLTGGTCTLNYLVDWSRGHYKLIGVVLETPEGPVTLSTPDGPLMISRRQVTWLNKNASKREDCDPLRLADRIEEGMIWKYPFVTECREKITTLLLGQQATLRLQVTSGQSAIRIETNGEFLHQFRYGKQPDAQPSRKPDLHPNDDLGEEASVKKQENGSAPTEPKRQPFDQHGTDDDVQADPAALYGLCDPRGFEPPRRLTVIATDNRCASIGIDLAPTTSSKRPPLEACPDLVSSGLGQPMAR